MPRSGGPGGYGGGFGGPPGPPPGPPMGGGFGGGGCLPGLFFGFLLGRGSRGGDPYDNGGGGCGCGGCLMTLIVIGLIIFALYSCGGIGFGWGPYWW